MSTHNKCFRGEIRKILCGYPLLSVAMATCGKDTGTLLALSMLISKSPDDKCFVCFSVFLEN